MGVVELGEMNNDQQAGQVPPPPQQGQQGQYGAQQPMQVAPSDDSVGLGIASIMCALLLPFIGAVLGLIFGIMAMGKGKEFKRVYGRNSDGEVMGIIGVVLSGIAMVTAILGILLVMGIVSLGMSVANDVRDVVLEEVDRAREAQQEGWLVGSWRCGGLMSIERNDRYVFGRDGEFRVYTVGDEENFLEGSYTANFRRMSSNPVPYRIYRVILNTRLAMMNGEDATDRWRGIELEIVRISDREMSLAFTHTMNIYACEKE